MSAQKLYAWPEVSDCWLLPSLLTRLLCARLVRLLSTGGTDSETDDDQGMEADTDEEDEIFFDTKETLGSYRSTSSDPSEHSEADESSDVELVGFNYPKVQRRSKLPEPKEKEKSVSLWAMIKDNIGKDLTKVCLPVYFNEPISSLQKCLEDLEYSYLLDRAQQYGKQVHDFLNGGNVSSPCMVWIESSQDEGLAILIIALEG